MGVTHLDFSSTLLGLCVGGERYVTVTANAAERIRLKQQFPSLPDADVYFREFFFGSRLCMRPYEKLISLTELKLLETR